MNIRLTATQVSRDRWLVSYADFMTLLCAFFTTMYAAAIAEPKAAAVSAPVELVAPAPAPPAPTVAELAEAERMRQAAELRANVETALAPELAAGYLELVDDPRGLVIEVPEAAAFDVGQADLAPAATAMFRRVAVVLASLPNPVRIEGHTDDVPIRTSRFGSNWDLSTARATRVVEFLIAQGGLSADRLSAAGYSQFKPRAANASAVGRARNRRVDLILLNAATARAEEPAGAMQP